MRFYGNTSGDDLTYSDVFLVPSRSSVTSRLEVDDAPDDCTGVTTPVAASIINPVSGPVLAATMARRGGLGVLPQDMPLQDLDAAIRWVKDQPTWFDTALRLAAHDTVST